jgi:TRAP-type mannitol/chloroaromatic compound transport system substrate-binding protein
MKQKHWRAASNTRRGFLGAAAGLASGVVAAPAIAQAKPSIKWRMASSYPKSLDTVFGATEQFIRRLAILTDDKFQIRVFAAGEIVPGLQVLDAVQNETVECGNTNGYYYVGKNKALAMDTSLPFGLNSRQQNAWMYYGGGLQLMRELWAQYGVISFPCGNTGCQMGGWWRKEMKSLADIKGLKFRIPGIGGEIWARLGLVPQTIPGGDIYPALERGTIDGAEWVGPYDDEKLGFYKVAKHYYFPGWWEPSTQVSYIVNLKQWASLPKDYQSAFEVAAAEANLHVLASYDAKNPAALQRLVNQGVKLHAFPRDVLVAAHKAAFELYSDEAAKNPAFKKIYENWNAFRKAQVAWSRIAEQTQDAFVASLK